MSQEPVWWYCSQGNSQKSVPETELKALAASGQLQPTDLVWKEGFTDWVEAASVPDLIPPQTAMPPPLPPQPPQPVVSPISTEPQVSINLAKPTSSSSSSSPDLNQHELLSIFVDKNYDYYTRKWELMSDRKSKSSFNWAAFFLTFLWMAYRKMYLYSFATIGLTMLSGVLGILINPSGIFSNSVGFGISLATGFGGNYWYKKHAENKIKMITASATNLEAAKLVLAKQGGVSWWSVFGFTTIFAIFIAIAIFIEIQMG